MPSIRLIVIAAVASLLLSACVAGGFYDNQPNQAEQKLTCAVFSYDDGDYKIAIAGLQNALDSGLRSKNEQALAHKYLAFIHCIAGDQKQCHEEFKKALMIDPSFDLSPSEAGHPMWGPVFKSEKSRLAE
jgi:Tfp pilus assembly protein PilF